MAWMHLVVAWALVAGAKSEQEAAVAAARGAVQERLSAPDSRISLMDVEQVRWGDTSLGCPAKGEDYSPVVTEGYRVHLRVDDRTFDVRVAGSRAVVCDRTAQGGESDAVVQARLYRQARKDLAGRLNVPESEIRVDFIRPKVWRDERLECRVGDSTAEPASRTPGYLIQLSAKDRAYEYHADHSRVVACDVE